MRKNLAKKISILLTVAILCAVLAGCYEATATARGTYIIHSVVLVPNKLNIVGFENQRGRPMEFGFGEENFVSVSFIFFIDPEGDRTYHAQFSSGPTTYETDGNQITLDFDFDFEGEMDIRVHDGWIILDYSIGGQLVYSARYRKTA